MIIETVTIARLQLRPEDTLVVKAVHTHISDAEAERVRREVREVTGHQKVMVIDRTIDLSVLSAEDVAKMSAQPAEKS